MFLIRPLCSPEWHCSCFWGYWEARVGVSYALGIFLQFLNNNLVDLETAEALILSLFALVALALLLKAERLCRQENAEAEELQSPAIEDDGKGTRKKIAAGGLLALLVILMACIFSTLDNAVTMHHAAGTDIGQWPRLLLAVSGLSAGFLFDIRKRKFMAMMMYCVMLMSVICSFGWIFCGILHHQLSGFCPPYAHASAVGRYGARHE